jgi:hypothetical protein
MVRREVEELVERYRNPVGPTGELDKIFAR